MGITIKADSPLELEQLGEVLGTIIKGKKNPARTTRKRKRRTSKNTPKRRVQRKKVASKVRPKKKTTTKQKKKVCKKKTAKRKRKSPAKKVVTFRKKRLTLTRGTIGFPTSVKNRTRPTESLWRGTSGGKVYAVWLSKKTGKVTGTEYIPKKKK